MHRKLREFFSPSANFYVTRRGKVRLSRAGKAMRHPGTGVPMTLEEVLAVWVDLIRQRGLTVPKHVMVRIDL